MRLALAEVALLLGLLLPLRLGSDTIAAPAALTIATADITAATAVIATTSTTAATIVALLLPGPCGGRRTRCLTPVRKPCLCSFAIVSLHLWALGAAELLGSTLTLTERTCVWVRGLRVKGFETLTLTPKTDLTLTLTLTPCE